MECGIRPWKLENPQSLATIINNQSILDNLRDGIPFTYTVKVEGYKTKTIFGLLGFNNTIKVFLRKVN